MPTPLPSLNAPARSSGVAGIAAGVLFAVAVLASHLPGGNATPASVVHYYGTRTHQVTALLLAYALAGAALSLAWFLIGLLLRVRRAEPTASSTTLLACITGITTVTSLLLSSGALFAMAGPPLFEHDAKPGQATVTAGQLAISLLIISMLAAAVAIFAGSRSASRARALPRWNTRLGYLCAVLLGAGSVMGSPMIAFAIWLVATGVTLSRQRTGPVARPPGLGTPRRLWPRDDGGRRTAARAATSERADAQRPSAAR